VCVQAAQLDQSNQMESRFPFFSPLSQSFLSFSIRYMRSLLRAADPFLSFLVVASLPAFPPPRLVTTKSHRAYLIPFSTANPSHHSRTSAIPSHTPKNTPTPPPSTPPYLGLLFAPSAIHFRIRHTGRRNLLCIFQKGSPVASSLSSPSPINIHF
jgi:hypothetical protein